MRTSAEMLWHLQITSAPPTVCGTAKTKVAFNASKSDASFLCQLTNTDAGAPCFLLPIVERLSLDIGTSSVVQDRHGY